jgi:predicted nuclease of predicted toxin-antitoxin system
MKILIDMNLSPEWVKTFANNGIEAKHWSNIGDKSAMDEVIMQWALNNSYIVFTNDLDFGSLLAVTQAQFPSVIQVRAQDLLPQNLEKIVMNALKQFELELESGALVTIDISRSKVRILPIMRNIN